MKLAATLLALVLVGPASAEPQEPGIQVGSAAPTVTIGDLDGAAVSLGPLIGTKPLFIEWWATWCGLCDALLPRVRAAHERFGDRVEFIGVNVTVNQSRARVRRYVEMHRPPFRTLYDEEGTSARAYSVPTTSYVVIVDRRGRVAYTGVGAEQDFETVLARVAAEP